MYRNNYPYYLQNIQNSVNSVNIPINPQNIPLDNRYRVAPSLGAAAFGGLIAGLVSGATLTATRSIKKVNDGKMTKKEAGAEILHEASLLGVATTVGVTTTALLNLRGVASIAGVALFTAGTKYCLDSLTSVKKDDENLA